MEELNNKTEGVESTNSTEEKETYTKEEVEKLLQSETDRRVTNALKKQEAKNQEKVREAQKLASMNEEQKYLHELELREKAIAEKEQALAMAENKNVASSILAEKGLSLKLVDFVVDTDADVMNERIKLLDKAFKDSVKTEVEKRLGSPTPTKAINTVESITRDSLKNMSASEIMKFKMENPEAWNELANQILN